MSWVRVDAPPQQRAQSRPARPRPVAAVDLRSTVAEVQAALSGHGRTGTASHWEHRLRASLVVADSLALLGAVAASTALQSDVPVTLGLLVVPVWLLILASQGAYDSRHVGAGGLEAKRLADSAVRLGLGVVVVSYVLRHPAGRDLLLLTLPLGLAALVAARLAGRAALVRLRRAGHWQQRVVAIGTVLDVVHLVEHARRSPAAGFTVVGACVPTYAGPDRRRPAERRGAATSGTTPPPRQRSSDRRAEDDRRAGRDQLTTLGVPVVGQPQGVLDAVTQLGADTVAVAGHGVLSRTALRRLAWQLEGTRVRLLVASALTEVATPRISLRPLGGLPLLQVEAPVFSGARRVLKGVLDRVLAALLVALLSPLLLALAILIRLDSPGPVLFRQARVGRDGVEFTCFKLRTMRVGADREVAALATRNESDGVLFKMRADPRVTRVGRVLRRLSLDELPQLFNVLGGSMSLVGPRPPLPSEVAQYRDDVRRRLLVKPGMTGLWQVSGRSDLSWAESVRLDLYYVENWSPYLDLSLMARTVAAVLKGRGAY